MQRERRGPPTRGVATAPPEPPMHPDLSWVGVLEHHAGRTPNKPLAVSGDGVVTYQEMVGRSAALAAGLHQRGVRAGDVVGLLSYNNTEFLTAIFAANHLGAMVMPLNWRLAAAELRYILDHSRARALVCDEPLIELADDASRGLADLVRVCIAETGPAGWERFSDLGAGTPPLARAHVRGDDIQRLMYTSGTTGRPKGAMITNANLAWKNLCAHNRIRAERCRCRAGLRPALPRRRARPHHDFSDCRGGDGHPPPGLRC